MDKIQMDTMLRKFFDFRTWDTCDFGGWQTDEVADLLISVYNGKWAKKDEYIFPMRDFKTLLKDGNILAKYNGCTEIRQSVMSFQDYEVTDGLMGEFDETNPYARIGYADNRTIPYKISMTNEDVGYWIMYSYGNVDDIVSYIHNMCENDRISLVSHIMEYIIFHDLQLHFAKSYET